MELATRKEGDKLVNETMRQVYLWWDQEGSKAIEKLKKVDTTRQDLIHILPFQK